MASALLLSALLLLSPSIAQSATNNNTYTYLDLTFSSPGARNCGQGSTGEGNAVTFSITSPPASRTCFNVHKTLSQPNVTYSTSGYSCLYDQPCGANYTITGAEHFDAAANYSQIWYRQSSLTVQSSDDDDNEDHRVGRLQLWTYNGLDCLQVSGDDGELGPWYTWNCNTLDGECGNVPYDVMSFAIAPVDEDDQGDGGCLVTAEYGAGTRPGIESSLIALVAFALAAVLTQ